jgi:N-acetylglucosamine kinase-like BadF-type ATPase
MAKTTTIRARRSKPEVEKEFAKIADEVAEQKESSDAKAAEVAKLRQAEIEQAVEGVSVEGVVEKLSSLGLEISKALADISAKLVPKWNA